MSEERFCETERNCYYTSLVFDNHTQEKLGTTKVADLLNEQQTIIHSLKEEIRLLKPTNIEQYEQIIQLQEDNKQLQKELEKMKLLNESLGCLQMSEKRFVYEEEPYHFPAKKRIRDTQNNETYIYDLRECCELLNEKQVSIEQLKSVLRKQFNIITDKDLLEYV